MTNTTLYTQTDDEAEQNRLDGIKSEKYAGADINIVGNSALQLYGIEAILKTFLSEEFPEYLIEKVRFVFSTDYLPMNFYTPVIDNGKLIQEVFLDLNISEIALNIYVFLRGEQRLSELGIIQEDFPDDSKRRDEIIEILKKGEYVEQITAILQEIMAQKTYKRDLARMIPIYTLFHELTHAFLDRIYPSDLSQVIKKEDQNNAIDGHFELLEKIDLIVEEEAKLRGIDTHNAERSALYEVGLAVVKRILSLEDFTIDQDKKEESFRNLYTAGIQEIWARLMESRYNLIKEKIHDNDPAMKYDRSFHYVYRSGAEIVDDTLRAYIGSALFIPLELLDELAQQETLTVEYIDKYIQEKLLPLMDKSTITKVKKEYMPYLK